MHHSELTTGAIKSELLHLLQYEGDGLNSSVNLPNTD